jgi:hypothetical protein
MPRWTGGQPPAIVAAGFPAGRLWAGRLEAAEYGRQDARRNGSEFAVDGWG